MFQIKIWWRDDRFRLQWTSHNNLMWLAHVRITDRLSAAIGRATLGSRLSRSPWRRRREQLQRTTLQTWNNTNLPRFKTRRKVARWECCDCGCKKLARIIAHSIAVPAFSQPSNTRLHVVAGVPGFGRLLFCVKTPYRCSCVCVLGEPHVIRDRERDERTSATTWAQLTRPVFSHDSVTIFRVNCGSNKHHNKMISMNRLRNETRLNFVKDFRNLHSQIPYKIQATKENELKLQNR